MTANPLPIPRLDPPRAGQTAKGWCLYQYDRWDGPVPHDRDDQGWLAYPDRATAFLGLARELRRRCDLFDAGRLLGEELACTWYLVAFIYLPDGCVRDETGAEFAPGCPW